MLREVSVFSLLLLLLLLKKEVPMSWFGRADEPFKVNTVIIGHEWCVIEHGREQVDCADSGQQQEDGLVDGALFYWPAEMVTKSQWDEHSRPSPIHRRLVKNESLWPPTQLNSF